ncbi:MAG: recombination regulator RecX [Bacteroidetes bacterium]|nr:recombination regulator RecX [Bacteroidota bacterium]
MKITALTKKGNNVLVCFEDGEFVTIDYRTVLDYGLRKFDDIDDNKKLKLISDSEFVKAKDSSFRILAKRQHSGYELRNKLFKKGYTKETIDRTLQAMQAGNYLNDEQFTKAFIDERLRRKKIGVNKLKAELFKRGIARNIIEQNLSGIDWELSYENALSLARRKTELLVKKGIEPHKIKQKIFAFLSSRGYDSETIMKILHTLELREE